MREGDIIEWQGANTTHRGTVTIRDNGELAVTLPDGSIFPLDDLRFSKSLRVL